MVWLAMERNVDVKDCQIYIILYKENKLNQDDKCHGSDLPQMYSVCLVLAYIQAQQSHYIHPHICLLFISFVS